MRARPATRAADAAQAMLLAKFFAEAVPVDDLPLKVDCETLAVVRLANIAHYLGESRRHEPFEDALKPSARLARIIAACQNPPHKGRRKLLTGRV